MQIYLKIMQIPSARRFRRKTGKIRSPAGAFDVLLRKCRWREKEKISV